MKRQNGRVGTSEPRSQHAARTPAAQRPTTPASPLERHQERGMSARKSEAKKMRACSLQSAIIYIPSSRDPLSLDAVTPKRPVQQTLTEHGGQTTHKFFLFTGVFFSTGFGLGPGV